MNLELKTLHVYGLFLWIAMIWLNACCTKWGRRNKIRERVKEMWTRQNKSVQNWSFSMMVSNVWPLDLLPHDVLLTAERWRCTHFNGPLCEGKPPTSVPRGQTLIVSTLTRISAEPGKRRESSLCTCDESCASSYACLFSPPRQRQFVGAAL